MLVASERWNPPNFSNLDALAEALTRACPDAEPVAPLRVLGEGFFSVAVATASNAVFRLGTSPDVFARYEKEARLLPWLTAHGLPAAVPAPRWLMTPSSAFPFGGIGYPLLEGRELLQDVLARGDRAGLARQIAEFVLALHRMPLEEARALGLPGPEVELAWLELDRSACLEATGPVLTFSEHDALVHWWDALMREAHDEACPPVLVHGDIGGDNLLVDEGGTRLLAVVDFEHAHLGDARRDFAWLSYLSAEFMAEVMDEYVGLGGEIDPGMPHRLERDRQRIHFPGIRRAWLRGEPVSRSTALRALRQAGLPTTT